MTVRVGEGCEALKCTH